MGLRAPARITVEIREVAARPDPARCFRLTRSIGPDGLELERPAAFAPGTPVVLRLRLPGGEEHLEVAGADDAPAREIVFGALDDAARRALRAYLEERLGLT
jgi:hypothetical protein